MAEYYTINQIIEMTGLSDSHVRKTIRKYQVEAAYTHKREKYYPADEIDQLFSKHYYRMDEPETLGEETQDLNQVIIRKNDYDNMVANLGMLKGKLEELEHSREYWERERSDLQREKEELKARIRELEGKIENYHETPWWKHLFR